MRQEKDIEIKDTPREFARKIIGNAMKVFADQGEGWGNYIPQMREGMRVGIESVTVPGGADFERKVKQMMLEEIDALLDDLTGITPERMLIDYPDLLPPDLRAKLFNGAIEVIRDMGLGVDVLKDDDGEDIVRLTVPDDCKMPQEDIDELTRLAEPYAVKRKRLHRVQ
ncbi:hypothetical protein [Thalassospira sp. MCCC 1A01428]|uniref:hypothetical protein n=1 Tax=Thalassospira sp. MCCC 1A01428 TaxID=1470575 RepID=UPI000A1F807A|nr:hypothetical protein [Thalassospira sp. MCCC 1A01428]OSQ34368.1 hypothetical protein THS27_25525 [Thalassospira sp. MCCC 1A01428]